MLASLRQPHKPVTECNSIFRAAIPEPYRVLGLKLKPFSLGHYFILHRHGCAFVSDEPATATREDLVFAVLVCSMTAKEFESWWSSPLLKWPAKIRSVLSLIFGKASLNETLAALKGDGVARDLIQWGRKCGIFDVCEKASLFAEYLKEHTESPKYWKEREEEASGSHWAHNVFVTLVGLGFPQEAVWDMSLREALAHFYKHAENCGAVRLMTDQEIKEVEACGP